MSIYTIIDLYNHNSIHRPTNFIARGLAEIGILKVKTEQSILRNSTSIAFFTLFCKAMVVGDVYSSCIRRRVRIKPCLSTLYKKAVFYLLRVAICQLSHSSMIGIYCICFTSFIVFQPYSLRVKLKMPANSSDTAHSPCNDTSIFFRSALQWQVLSM